MKRKRLKSLVQTAYYISYKKRPFQQRNGLALVENDSNAKGCQMFMNIIGSFLHDENKLDLGLYVVVVVVTSMATRRKFPAS